MNVYAFLMLAALFGLLSLLGVALWERYKAGRDAATDARIRAGLATAYRKGWVAKGSVMGEMWLDQRERK